MASLQNLWKKNRKKLKLILNEMKRKTPHERGHMVPYCLNLEIGFDVFHVRFPATLKSAQEAHLQVREKKTRT